jgi:uncharacterized OsmC-like protein
MSTAPTLAYEVDARTVQAGHSEVSAKRATIAFDSSPQTSAELPGPAELLCSAFAACLLKNVERFSEILPFSQHGASVHVSAEREQTPPMFTRIRYRLEVVTEEAPERVEHLHRNLAKYGTVYNTIARACEVSGDVVGIAPEEPGPE